MTTLSYLMQLKVLYIEDDDNTREDLKQFLRKKVGKVITAADGEEGLNKFKTEKPDIIIADILLPKLNGIDMIRQIREMGGKCPVIITSTVEKTSTILNAVDVGIVKYAVKPIILEELLETLMKTAEELKENTVVFNDIELKMACENEIKQAVTGFLKKTIGKGPRDLNVFIGKASAEINVFGLLTPMEKKVLENRHNVSLIEHLRQSYYNVVMPELEHIISQITQTKVKFKSMEFNVLKGNDHIEFSLVASNE